ncbi:MAG: homoserine kinase [Mycobacteriales bacterium]
MSGPAFRAAMVRIQVPATSANLGPGFDALGLAVGLYDVVLARVTDSGLRLDIAGEGAATLRRDGRHRVVSAMRETFALLGGQPRGLEVVCANRIPQGRGLGSSAAAIVAGVSAARALVLGGLPDADALALAARLEGHPDNVAACLFGGATLAWTEADGTARAVRLPVHPDLRPVLLVPPTTQRTKAARALLPEQIPHADAAHSAGRAALLVHALGTRPDLLLAATEDALHEPYRLAAQARTRALVARLRAAGLPAVLSGSGPSVLVLARSEAEVGRAAGLATDSWSVHRLVVDRDGARPVAE